MNLLLFGRKIKLVFRRDLETEKIKRVIGNNAYHRGLAKERDINNHLAVLVDEDGPVHSTADMLGVASAFYNKNLFRFEAKHNAHLGPDF